jgi:pimeloyl-ACP methyl ester carboxylesterase
MGNVLSEEEENEVLEEAYTLSLDSPDVDKKVNQGTTAANCQPKHTSQELKQQEGTEVAIQSEDSLMEPNSHKHARASSSDSLDHRGKRVHATTEEERQQKLSYVQMAKLGYQELVNAIIRPPRAEYKEETLGPPAFSFCGKRFTRTDFTLMTKRGLNLQCSHWEPVERTSDRIPVVIYMHGNSSARVEVLPQLSYLLSLGLAVFSFDFAGSGKSDGDFVSLGYYEREDLMCVIAHLRATNVVSTIALWGRSMGAATALMHGDRDPSIACMILDSSFSDLTKLAEEMVERGREQGIIVPNIVVSVALRMIANSVRKQANFNIKHISPIAHADKCFIPALFVAGEHDDFINKSHSERIYKKYAGDKNLIIVEGDHNSPRPKFMFDSASIFLQTCLQIPNTWALPIHPGMNLMAPPWYYPGTYPNPRTVRSPVRPMSAPSSRGGKEKKRNHNLENDEMGMTQERQREIQASLFKMLGQPDEPTGNAESSSS